MASQRITREDLFPNGTTVTAYPASNWATWQLPPSGVPVGSAEGTAGVMTAGAATITGLTDGRNFFGYAQVGGVDRYVRFKASRFATVPAVAAANLDADNGQAGMVCIPPGVGRVAVGLTAQRAWAVRFRPTRDMLIVKMGFHNVTAAAVDDPCDVGLYDSAGVKIVSTGATSGLLNVLGAKKPPITSTLLRGGVVYYAAFSVGTIGGTTATVEMTAQTANPGTAMYGTAMGKVEQGFVGSSHPLPASLTLGLVTNAPVMYVLEE